MNNKQDFQKIIRNTVADFLSEYSLYQKLEIFAVYSELDNREIMFEAYCKEDNRNTTFKIESNGAPTLRHKLNEGGLYLSRNASCEYEFSIHCSGVCQMCGTFKNEFLITGKSSRDKGELKVHIQKAGQYPAVTIRPDKVLREFMTDEDIEFYQKGKLSLQQNYGIGAYAYFRRILENEILNIANRLIETNDEARTIIGSAVEQYFKNHQTTPLIKSLTPYIPKPLLINNENPILKLYSKLSEGIHGLTEDECTDLAREIEKVLRHVIIEMRNRETKDHVTNSYNKLKGKI